MHADTLVLNIDWLVTVDGGRRIIRDGAVDIEGGKLCAVGKSSEIAMEWSAPDLVGAKGKVAFPGPIDSHLHSSFQLARGLADEVGTRAFLLEHMFPYEGAMSTDDVSGNSVSDVFVAGERVVQAGHLIKFKEAEILRMVGNTMQRIGQKLDLCEAGKLQWPVT